MRNLLLALAMVAVNAFAQPYPSRPITLVVPYTPGTGIAGPAGLPREIVQKWNQEIASIVALPEVRETLMKFIAETGITAD